MIQHCSVYAHKLVPGLHPSNDVPEFEYLFFLFTSFFLLFLIHPFTFFQKSKGGGKCHPTIKSLRVGLFYEYPIAAFSYANVLLKTIEIFNHLGHNLMASKRTYKSSRYCKKEITREDRIDRYCLNSKPRF